MNEALDLSPMDTPESPASGYSSSPSHSPKRDGLIFEPSEEGSKTSSCLRFLVSNAAAGSVIGKGGATVSDFQSQSGARIQLSRNHEYFPGTTDRIILVTGSINEILTAVNLILQKLLSEADDNNDVDEKSSQVRLVLPNSVCGGIIGKGGATIKFLLRLLDRHSCGESLWKKGSTLAKRSGKDVLFPSVGWNY